MYIYLKNVYISAVALTQFYLPWILKEEDFIISTTFTTEQYFLSFLSGPGAEKVFEAPAPAPLLFNKLWLRLRLQFQLQIYFTFQFEILIHNIYYKKER